MRECEINRSDSDIQVGEKIRAAESHPHCCLGSSLIYLLRYFKEARHLHAKILNFFPTEQNDICLYLTTSMSESQLSFFIILNYQLHFRVDNAWHWENIPSSRSSQTSHKVLKTLCVVPVTRFPGLFQTGCPIFPPYPKIMCHDYNQTLNRM